MGVGVVVLEAVVVAVAVLVPEAAVVGVIGGVLDNALERKHSLVLRCLCMWRKWLVSRV